MDFRTIMFLVSIITFLSYVSYVWIKYGIQRSISESYYALQKNKLGFLFTLFTVFFAYPIGMIASNVFITPAAMLICLVGVARAFKDNKIFYIAHMFAAYTGVALSQVGIWIVYDMWYITLGFLISSGLLFIFNEKNKIWWAEILAIISIYIAVGSTL